MAKYKLPEILVRFDEASQKDSKIVGIEPLGFRIEWGLERTDYYSSTPPDVIPFAWTGGDGDHFGFLTDFGEVADLADAHIVSVTPANDPQITICAKNINDFLSLMCELKESIYLSSFYSTPKRLDTPEKEWYSRLSPRDDDAAAGRTERIGEWTKSLLKKLKLSQINNPYAYLKKTIKERESRVSINTIDNIGVLRTDKSGKTEKSLINLTENIEIKSIDLEKILALASHDQKLAFCRDAQQVFCLMVGDYGNEEMKDLVTKVLLDMGYNYESNRINKL